MIWLLLARLLLLLSLLRSLLLCLAVACCPGRPQTLSFAMLLLLQSVLGPTLAAASLASSASRSLSGKGQSMLGTTGSCIACTAAGAAVLLRELKLLDCRSVLLSLSLLLLLSSLLLGLPTAAVVVPRW
jgi:hypothetical protein